MTGYDFKQCVRMMLSVYFTEGTDSSSSSSSGGDGDGGGGGGGGGGGEGLRGEEGKG